MCNSELAGEDQRAATERETPRKFCSMLSMLGPAFILTLHTWNAAALARDLEDWLQAERELQQRTRPHQNNTITNTK